MEGYILMTSFLLSLIFPTKCCILSSPGECGGPCSPMGGQRLSYGGRMALVDSGGVDLGTSPPPWANQRVFVFRMPHSFFKRRHHHSIFGHKGIIGIVTGEAPCGGHTPVQNDCPLTTTQDSGSFCLDPTLPCYKTPPSYSQPEPLSFSDITPTSITVRWPAWDEEVDVGNGPIVDYKIEMRRVYESDFTTILKGRQLSHQFNNLDEGTAYEFRVTVIRDHPCGEGPPSNTQSHSTTTAGPPQYSNSEPLVLQDVTSSSLTISWPEWDPRVDRGTGPVIGCKILYRIQGTNGRKTKGSKVVRGLSTQLTGLLEHTTYILAIKLQYGNGEYAAKTNDQIFTTKCRDIDDIDLQLSSLSRITRYATISAEWSYNVIESCSVVEQNVIIQQLDSDGCPLQSPDESPFEKSLDGETRSYTKKGLEAYSQYNFTIALTTVVNGIFYHSAQIRTDSSEPSGEPLNLIKEEITDRRWVIFDWEELECGTRHGEVIGYEYEFHRSNGKNRLKTGTTDVTQSQKRFSSIKDGESYSFQVRAVTDKGSGPMSLISGTFGQG